MTDAHTEREYRFDLYRMGTERKRASLVGEKERANRDKLSHLECKTINIAYMHFSLSLSPLCLVARLMPYCTGVHAQVLEEREVQ